MKRLTLLLALSLLIAAGCAKQVPKNWAATGGSRSDATVTLSYQYVPISEIPVINDAEGLQTAIKRCQSWGYRDAEPFGGVTTSSQAHRDPVWGDTTLTTVSKTYQCLGQGTETRHK